MPEEIHDGCLKSLPLHEHKEWLEACAEVLNEEWPRSKTARLHMLEKSNPSLPYCIVLLEQQTSNEWALIGHSRLCMVHGQTNTCFVESVVIKKSKRGQGLGRKLMEITEQHAMSLGYTTLYLTTHDKQDFYGHIGYKFCDPVVSLGSASKLLPSSLLDSLFGQSSNHQESARHSDQSQRPLGGSQKVSSASAMTQNGESSTSPAHSDVPKEGYPAPPPPPPVPPPPPPAVPPSHPPALTPSAVITTPSSQLTHVRLDPSQIFWMKKALK